MHKAKVRMLRGRRLLENRPSPSALPSKMIGFFFCVPPSVWKAIDIICVYKAGPERNNLYILNLCRKWGAVRDWGGDWQDAAFGVCECKVDAVALAGTDGASRWAQPICVVARFLLTASVYKNFHMLSHQPPLGFPSCSKTEGGGGWFLKRMLGS